MRLFAGAARNDDWPDVGSGEMLAITNPALAAREYRELLEAGADAIATITFGATATVMLEYEIRGRVAEANFENARLARAACNAMSTPERPRLVLGSMGPTLRLLTIFANGGTFEELQSEYREQAEALIRGGVDLLHLDQCMDMENLRAAIEAIRSLGTAVPVMISAQFELMGTLLDGTAPERFVDTARAYGAKYVGISGHLQAAMTAFRSLEEAGKPPDALLIDTFQPGCEIGWVLSPEELAAGLAPVVEEARIPIIGIGTAPRADFVTALAALL